MIIWVAGFPFSHLNHRDAAPGGSNPLPLRLEPESCVGDIAKANRPAGYSSDDQALQFLDFRELSRDTERPGSSAPVDDSRRQ